METHAGPRRSRYPIGLAICIALVALTIVAVWVEVATNSAATIGWIGATFVTLLYGVVAYGALRRTLWGLSILTGLLSLSLVMCLLQFIAYLGGGLRRPEFLEQLPAALAGLYLLFYTLGPYRREYQRRRATRAI